MAKRGYKLQEFVAHSENVNCLSIGKKACRLLLTGGDDNKVNVWAIGKPTSLMSLCGHTSTVESVAFDSEEVLVLAGSSSGVLKLWDLEESKMVRGLTAHRSNCTAVDFHPFGEFFASGSMDTNLKIWDIRKKGCIHTYKGHTRGISTTRFTPDGRWVISGGFDNVVKVWDLTAGKLLHDLTFHEGHISSIDFHPLEFLLATGSADRTVKFWDLETFELIGSTRPEATGVRAISFHPDGRTLFSGSDDVLKVYSWEPVVCHDSVDMGWSTLGDLCIHEGKLLGCSYFENSVGVWVADTSHVKPYGDDIVPEQNECVEKKCNLNGSHSSEKNGIGLRTNFGLRSLSPDDEMKDIKNIYVDTSAGSPVSSQRVDSINSSKLIPPLDPYEVSDSFAEKQSPVVEIQTVEKSVVVPSNVPKHSQSGRESIIFSKTKPGMLLRPAHAKKPSKTKFDFEKLSSVSESDTFSKTKGKLDSEGHLSSETRTMAEDKAINSHEEKCSDIKCDAEKFEKTSSPQTTPNKETGKNNHDSRKDTSSVKIVNGVAVVSGRTRTLVERFEKREILKSSQCETTVASPHMISESDRTIIEMKAESQPVSSSDQNICESCLPGKDSTSPVDMIILGNQFTRTESSSVCDRKVTVPNDEPSTPDVNENVINCHQESYLPESFVPGRYFTSPVDRTILGHQTTGVESSFADDRKVTVPDDEQSTPDGNQNIINSGPSSRDSTSISGMTSIGSQSIRKESNSTYDRKVTVTDTQSARRESTSANDEMMSRSQKGRQGPIFAKGRKVAAPEIQVSRRESISLSSGTGMGSTLINEKKVTLSERQSSRRELASPGDRIMPRSQISRPRSANDRKISASGIQISRRVKIPPGDESVLGNQVSKMGSISATNRKVIITSENHISRREAASNMDEDVKMEAVSADERDILEKLMETHDVFVSTLRSRLTKLQVVRHFWVKSDTKSAISALQKLPDHSVQADVISVLMENTESFTLEFFSYLLPVLMCLLDSQMERHACVSLEMLLKLVSVFGPVIHSTVSAPRAVGVDIHAEQRREWCNQCFKQLQKIQKLLPAIIRRGGVLARNAEELNLVL